jgi:hypothetical protein
MSGCALSLYLGIFAVGVLPSYLIANHRAHPAWQRIAAVVGAPAFLALAALSMPTYPPGENLDDWRRGTLFGLSIMTAITSAAVQVVIVVGRLLRRWIATSQT